MSNLRFVTLSAVECLGVQHEQLSSAKTVYYNVADGYSA